MHPDPAGRNTKSVKAFDFDGKPWRFFDSQRSSVLALPQDASNITWLDIAIESTDLLYVLSYMGSGSSASDYRLDISNRGRRNSSTTIGLPVTVADSTQRRRATGAGRRPIRYVGFGAAAGVEDP